MQHYLLLAGALRVLQGGTRDGERTPSLILDSYLLRAMAIAGYAPSFVDCARCGLEGPHRAFSPTAGGVVCEPCRPAGVEPADAPDPGPAQRPARGPLGGDPGPARGDHGRGQHDHRGYVAWHLDRNLRSLAHVER